MSDLAAARARYVERIAKRERISSKRLLEALATVPREDFLPRGPWRIKGEAARSYRLTRDADPIHLYENVLVAIDARRRLDTGLPSLWAHFIDVLDVGEKDRVVQIGCGLGYFSAVLSKMVGPKGSVCAIECDDRLAARAANHLRGYRRARRRHHRACRLLAAPSALARVAPSARPSSGAADPAGPRGRRPQDHAQGQGV
jgi:protein-L-isoaspartate(D-aspartate) O-methyltransferase